MSNLDGETLWGRHAVLAAIKSGHPVQRLLLANGAHGHTIDAIFDAARKLRIPYDLRDRNFLDRIAGTNHQGVVAYLAAHNYTDFADVIKILDRKTAFLVFLDGIQDPHNLGAIIRTAHVTGADALIIPQRGSAGLTATAAKAAAGAASHLPICRVGNFKNALNVARDAGLWSIGLAGDAEPDFTTIDFRSPVALVIGSESSGLRRLTRESCDFIARIPMFRNDIGSLNASVAAALALYEVYRQRCLE